MGRNRTIGVARVPGEPPQQDVRLGGARASAPVPRTPAREIGVADVSRIGESTRRIMIAPAVARPVFVDETGRRHRLLAWICGTVALLGLLLVIVLWLSQAGPVVGAADMPGCIGGPEPGCGPPGQGD